jgi:hypothetical protein
MMGMEVTTWWTGTTMLVYAWKAINGGQMGSTLIQTNMNK